MSDVPPTRPQEACRISSASLRVDEAEPAVRVRLDHDLDLPLLARVAGGALARPGQLDRDLPTLAHADGRWYVWRVWGCRGLGGGGGCRGGRGVGVGVPERRRRSADGRRGAGGHECLGRAGAPGRRAGARGAGGRTDGPGRPEGWWAGAEGDCFRGRLSMRDLVVHKYWPQAARFGWDCVQSALVGATELKLAARTRPIPSRIMTQAARLGKRCLLRVLWV